MVIFTEVPEHHLDKQTTKQPMGGRFVGPGGVSPRRKSPNDLIRADEGTQESLQEVQRLPTPVVRIHFLLADVNRATFLQEETGLLKVLVIRNIDQGVDRNI